MTTFNPPTNMRTFTTIWIGQLVSQLGSGLTGFALGVWIFQETGKATPFAITVLFANIAPVILGPLVGTIADRYNRKKIMILADTGNALATFAVFILLLSGDLQIWYIYGIALAGSIFGAFQEPAFNASVIMLVPKKELQRANGMAQMGGALGNLISPILGGLLFGLIGLQGIILIDFITFFAALFTLLISHVPQPEVIAGEEKAGAWQEALAGWQFLRKSSGLLGLMIFFAIINFTMNFSSVLTGPMVLATFSPEVLGVIYSVFGGALFIGSLIVSTTGGPKHGKIKFIFGTAVVSILGLGLAGLRANAFLIGAGFFLMAIFIPMISAASQSIFQVKVPVGLQGRVYAIRVMVSRSMMPLAFLIAGPLADYIFEPLMAPGGALANSFIAQITGAGPGRGIGVLFLINMVFGLLAIVLVWGNQKVRNIETNIPDVSPDTAAAAVN